MWRTAPFGDDTRYTAARTARRQCWQLFRPSTCVIFGEVAPSIVWEQGMTEQVGEDFEKKLFGRACLA